MVRLESTVLLTVVGAADSKRLPKVAMSRLVGPAEEVAGVQLPGLLQLPPLTFQV